jgi:hypothetical protein
MQTKNPICISLLTALLGWVLLANGLALAKAPKAEDGYYSNIPAVSETSAAPAPVVPAIVVPPVVPGAPPAVPESTSPTAATPVPAGAAPNSAAEPKSILIPVTGTKVGSPRPTVPGAIVLFNQRKYGDALKQFEWLDKHGQCTEKTHYYIARCCQQLSQVARAQRNYAWILAYGKDKQIRYYAQYGYRQLSRYSASRTYEGNGNYFQGFRGAGASMGGGGGGGGG